MRLAHPRFVVFLAVLVALAFALPKPMGSTPRAISAAFDIAAVIYVAWMTSLMARSDPEAIRRQAAANDAGRGALLLIATAVIGVVLVTVGWELSPHARRGSLGAFFPVLTLVIAWVFANTVYTLHYAHLWYDRDEDDGGDSGGLKFPGTEQPVYWDFAYFAFNNGMAYQVSDVSVTSTGMRKIVSFHCMLAFFFNIGVLALAFNIVGSAVTG
jgi:uncharacterized membrane protein